MAPWSALPAVLAGVALSWAAAANANSAADYFVHSLPGAPEGPLVKMHAGHVEVDPEHNGNLFFWHFQNQHIANRQRTVIWLNGGPGCSSEDGALMEIGPYRLQDDHTLRYNEGSWHEFANLLFVDNPVGTGFSYVDTNSYLHELDEMADQFIIFLEKWFALFPEYEQDDLYIAGESFAGQYIPYIARHIVERNNKAGVAHRWALKGLLIGNGWISPPEQYEAYLSFAYQKGLVDKDSEIARKLDVQLRICQKELALETKVDSASCEAVLQELLQLTAKGNAKGKETCYNMYDVRLTDTFPSCGMNWPPDLDHVRPYLRRSDVVQALHINAAKNTGWTECSGAVGSQFRAHNSTPSVSFLPGLLAEMPVLLFSGAEDLICNHLGTEQLIGNMEWNGGKGLELAPGTWAPRRDWTFEGEAAGFWQEARNLTYVLFYNSSHMVPFDYPRRTRDMLDRFMGVDISSIGGVPTDSRLDGEPGPETTVGGAAGNGTAAQEAEKERLSAAKWAAYQKSGEVVLVIVAVAAAVWGWWVWRERRKRSGYWGLATTLGGAGRPSRRSRRGGRGAAAAAAAASSSSGLEGFRSKRGAAADRDVEVGDFDESELDSLHVVETPTAPDGERRYSLGGDSEEEDEEGAGGAGGARKEAGGASHAR